MRLNYIMRTTTNWECVDSLVVSVAKPIRAITPGQYAAFYVGGSVPGGSKDSEARTQPLQPQHQRVALLRYRRAWRAEPHDLTS